MALTSLGSLNLSPYQQQIRADGALGYWRMDAVSGTTELDRGSGGNNGTISGGVTLIQPGALNDTDRAQLFNGVNGRMLIPSAVNPWGGDFTLEAWVNLTTTVPAEQGVLHKEVAATNGFRLGMVQTAKWQFWTTESGGTVSIASASNSAVINTWTYLAVTHAGSLFTFFVNAVAIGTSSASYTAPAGGGEVGGLGMGWPLTGWADEVAVYSTALSAAQVTRHFQLRKARRLRPAA